MAPASSSACAPFLEEGGFKGFTTTFEDLHGIKQLPGLAPQRFMADGYGFAGRRRLEDRRAGARDEGHGGGPPGGTSFMEDYTYHLSPKNTRSSARTCWRSAPRSRPTNRSSRSTRSASAARRIPCAWSSTPRPVPALNASLVDLGNRFRLIVNEVDTVASPKLPKLPVARAVWECRPDFKTACAAWILAGGAHHTGYSTSVTTEMIEDFTTIAGIELVTIDADDAPVRLETDAAHQRGLLPPRAGFARN
jgi:L-arabinose isomerase